MSRRIAWISPLVAKDVLRTANFSSALLKSLPRDWEIELFVDDEEWSYFESRDFQYLGFGIFHYQRLCERHSLTPFQTFIYQLEDHPSCCYITRLLQLYPGVCYFHDLNMNQLMLSCYEHSTSGVDLDRAMNASFGEGSIALGKYLARKWSLEVYDSLYINKEQSSDFKPVVFNKSFARELALSGSSVSPLALDLSQTKVGQGELSRIGIAGSNLVQERVVDVFELIEDYQCSWLIPSFKERELAESFLQRFFGGEHWQSKVEIFVAEDSEELGKFFNSINLFIDLRLADLRGAKLEGLIASELGISCYYRDPAKVEDSKLKTTQEAAKFLEDLLEDSISELSQQMKLKESSIRDVAKSYVSSYNEKRNFKQDTASLANFYLDR